MNQSTISSACRFCYNYTPPGPINTCCQTQPQICASNEFLSSISQLSFVVNNNTRTSERSLLLGQQQQFYQSLTYSTTLSTYSTTVQNSTTITNQLVGQLLQVRQQRAEPYQPYVYPVVPPSVLELQMRTANAGVPHSVFTIANCKGSQFVTT